MLAVCHVAIAFLAALPRVAGHAYLKEPPSRNMFYPSQNGYCPHCGNGGSKAAPGSVCGDGNQWPVGSNYVGTVRTPDRSYTAGSVVEFEVNMNVNHKGHHEFFICNRTVNSNHGAVECFQKFPLMRVPPEEMYADCVPNDSREDCQPIDPNYPGRWYHPPGMPAHKIHYRIPADLECSHCTLLWFWPTANSEAYDAASYSCYNKVLTAANWTRFDFCGWACSDSKCPVPYVQDTTAPRAPDPNAGPGYEEFRNCADIQVSPAGPAPAPNSAPTPAPTPSGPAPAPTPAPTPSGPAPSPAPGVGTCNPLGDCSQEGWCDIDAYVAWCASQGAQGFCPSPFCKQTAPAPAPSPGTTTCVAVPGLNNGVTDADCAKCPSGYQWWPCNFDGYCKCTDGLADLLKLPPMGKSSSKKNLRHHVHGAVLIQSNATRDHAKLSPEFSDEL